MKLRDLSKKEVIKWAIKLSITALALTFVFRKIDFEAFKQSILSTHVGYFLLALLAFNVSKLFAAFRILEFFKELGIKLTHYYNIRLSYVGMFYNLFLPGSIGGDGYKVLILSRAFKKVKTKLLVAASLLDRLSGMALLFLFACLLFLGSSFLSPLAYLDILVGVLAILVIPVFYLFTRLLFPTLIARFFSTTGLSVLVQVGQLATAHFLLLAIGISANYFDYLTLFMISSVVAVLPFTIGGVGARELVFLYGYEYLLIEQNKAIAFTLLFFMVTAISSFCGLFFSFNIDTPMISSESQESAIQPAES